MVNSINGIQLNTKPGMDFNSMYNVSNPTLTNNTTLTNNPLYNFAKVLFSGKQTDNIGEHSNTYYMNTGLVQNYHKKDESSFVTFG